VREILQSPELTAGWRKEEEKKIIIIIMIKKIFFFIFCCGNAVNEIFQLLICT
jgi:hypothetical protein